jgi:uroporphyrinogen-III synthase
MNMELPENKEFYEPKREKLKRAFRDLKPYLATAAIALLAYNQGRKDQRIEDLTEALNSFQTQVEEVETYIEEEPSEEENLPGIPGTLDQMENTDPAADDLSEDPSFT